MNAASVMPLPGFQEARHPAALPAPRRRKAALFPQNRRYMGNKHKLLDFIESVVARKCGTVRSVCDIFAGTGVVGHRFNRRDVTVIANDFLQANYVCLRAFLGASAPACDDIHEKIAFLNSLPASRENYFSKHFGGTYFTMDNARKIGAIREAIDQIAANGDEKCILLCSLLYATDKAANTVGHYDAFRRKLNAFQPVRLLAPSINYPDNANNRVHNKDANALVREIACDVLYIDPPYNSRQYSDAYHVLENLAEWKEPAVAGLCNKMDRSHIKSAYCLKGAAGAFADLVENADCKHILLSYNNTGSTKDGRSNARISDADIMRTLGKKGAVEVFERKYKAFTAGKSCGDGNVERIFYCKAAR